MFLPRPNYFRCTGLGGKYETLDGAITDKITMEDYQGEILSKVSKD
jgi:hypothetical protein